MTFDEKLPSIGTHAGAVHVVRVPGEDGDEDGWLQVEGRFEGWIVVEAQVGAVPEEHNGAVGGHGGSALDWSVWGRWGTG